MAYVRGFEDYDGNVTYSLREGKYEGSESTLYEWFITSQAIDACERTCYCCYQGTVEECREWIKKHIHKEG